MIEKNEKNVSSHRAASDFDRGFLNKVLTAEGYGFVAEVNQKRLGSLRRHQREKVYEKRDFFKHFWRIIQK